VVVKKPEYEIHTFPEEGGFCVVTLQVIWLFDFSPAGPPRGILYSVSDQILIGSISLSLAPYS
jgi:hypothetical protein